MAPAELDQAERLIRFSRHQLRWLLGFMLLLGGAFLVDLLAPDTFAHVPAPALWLVAGLALASSWGPGLEWGSPGLVRAMRAWNNDELRRAAQAKAFRNGFFVLLVYPPVCAHLLTWLGVPGTLPLVVGSGAWLGFTTFLASMLWYDR